MTAPIGHVFEIQRFCIHDGPGIRTTVFLKGCPLRCLWCHNPEGMASDNALSFLPEKCIGCGYCFRTCPRGAHKMTAAPQPSASTPAASASAAPAAGNAPSEKHELDRDLCVVCGACAKECYAKALELIGRDVTVDEALAEVLRDLPFYETSGGGMTLSGGEPLLQIDFSAALLEAARATGLHSAVETCGFAPQDRLERILPHVGLFLYDIKEMEPARHAEFTGVSNDRILANLRFLHDAGAAVLVRLPIIPGLNDRDDHFRAVAALAAELPRLQGFEVMPYHALGTSKLRRFGQEDRLGVIRSPEPETVRGWVLRLRSLGVTVRNDLS
jgi:glycyl-radical enzyme activating protein